MEEQDGFLFLAEGALGGCTAMFWPLKGQNVVFFGFVSLFKTVQWGWGRKVVKFIPMYIQQLHAVV